MQVFIEYLTRRIDDGKAEIAKMEEDGRFDDAVFAKVRVNIYDVCRTVTGALAGRPGAGLPAVKARFERFGTEWTGALEKARAHGDARNVVIGETKLEALADVIAHFPEDAS